MPYSKFTFEAIFEAFELGLYGLLFINMSCPAFT